MAKTMNNNNWFTKLLSLIFLVLIYSTSSAKEEQKNLMESYIGKWSGTATIQNIDRSGGWGPEGFLGFHEITKEVWRLYFNFDFIHPLDDPSIAEEYKKMGIPVENIKNFMLVPEGLRIKGYATVGGFKEYTHETKKYCEECRGKDGTTREEFLPVVISVGGWADLRKNKIDLSFENIPVKYARNLVVSHWFKPENIKFVEPDKILFDYKYQEGDPLSVEQNLSGELYKINLLKKTFPKDIKPNEPIQTDKKTRIEVILSSIGKVNIAENTRVVFESENLLEVVKGKIHTWYTWIQEIKYKAKFKVNTATAILAVRDTEYSLNVEDDGTTTLIVLDGEVEFSDKQNRKTVLVKKNQQSVVKPGELPSEPLDINPDQIPKWWE